MNLFNKSLLVAGITVLQIAVAMADEPVQRLFKGWQVTCNNLSDCDIRNADENMPIVIRHQAGPDGAAKLIL